MSNYLTRLAARSLNLTDVVKPRLASLFEPVPIGGELGIENWRTLEPAEEAVRETETPVKVQRRMDRPAEPPSINEPPSLFPAPPSIPPVAALQPITTDLFSPTTPALPLTPTPLVSSLVAEQPKANQSTKPLPPVPARLSPAPPRAETHPAISSVTSKPLQPSASESPLASSEREEATPSRSLLHVRLASLAAQSESRAEAVLTITPRLVEPARAPAPKQMEAEREAVESAPTIRVTIGRIEVRAVLPSPRPPAPRATPPAQALSLDDYLRSRSGGQR